MFGDDEPYYIGLPIANRINTFIGMAGANWGASLCMMKDFVDNFRGCSILNGFFPGSKDDDPMPKDMSLFLKELNINPTKEADQTFAIYSLYDSVKLFKHY